MARGSIRSLLSTLDPARYWERAAEQLQRTPAGVLIARRGQYAVLPLLAIAGG